MGDARPGGAESIEDPYLGLFIAGLFTLEQLLGAGAAARVYRASQLGLARHVAVKILNSTLSSSAEIQARFHREARLLSRVTHPAIVPALMTGELLDEAPTRGESFIVYEYVDGATLRHCLTTASILPLSVAIALAVATAEAVGAAHEHGIVHRDLKPENLMLSRNEDDPPLRVLDFGLARLAEPGATSLTRTGAVLGTPAYMSPEAARGQPATPRSDVYALAILAFELITGHVPFEDRSPIRMLIHHMESPPPPLIRPAGSELVPRAVQDVILKNLSKTPSDRAGTATEFAQTLLAAARVSHLPLEKQELRSVLWQTRLSLFADAFAPTSVNASTAQPRHP